MFMRLTRAEWIFTLLVATLGFSLVWVETARYGPGVSSDSAFYLSAAENFAAGKGFVDFGGGPLTFWPPLYPFLLGAIQWATGLAPFVSGRVINALTVSLIIISTAFLLKICFPNRRIWLYLGVLATVLALFLYSMGANIGSDLLYLWLVILFFWFSAVLISRPGIGLLLGLAIVSACAAMLRWIGLAQIAAGFLVVIVAYWKSLKRALISLVIFGAVSLTPFLLWTLGRNYRLYGTLFGSQEMEYVSIADNLAFTYAKVVHWLLPNTLAKHLPMGVIGLVLLVTLLLINRKADWLRWAKRWFSAPFLPILVFSIIYLVAITLTVYTADHAITDFYDDRYQSPLFFILLTGLFMTLDELVLVHIKESRQKIANWAIVILFTVWAFYPAWILYRFTTQSIENGVVAYNNYNTRQLNETDLVKFIRKYPFDPSLPIYTNYNEALYLLADRTSLLSPKDYQHYGAKEDYLLEHYQSWPPEPAVYVVWFRSNEKKNYYSPDQLSKVANVELLYKQKDGQVAIVRPRNQ